jgi:hypothetical protein
MDDTDTVEFFFFVTIEKWETQKTKIKGLLPDKNYTIIINTNDIG